MTTLCSQCGGPAELCDRCAGALCSRRLCAELHEASCSAAQALPAPPLASFGTRVTYTPARARTPKPKHRNPEVERALAEELVARVSQHRQAGRAALLVGDLDTAFDELWAARLLEPDLDRISAAARSAMPSDWELETDLTPLARALSAKRHPRTAETWLFAG